MIRVTNVATDINAGIALHRLPAPVLGVSVAGQDRSVLRRCHAVGMHDEQSLEIVAVEIILFDLPRSDTAHRRYLAVAHSLRQGTDDVHALDYPNWIGQPQERRSRCNRSTSLGADSLGARRWSAMPSMLDVSH